MCSQTKRFLSLLLMSMMLALLPAMVAAQSEQANAGQPPIGQTLVREGDFAVRLEAALSVGTSQDEIEAENQLTQAGIMPKNGWIADYPVTPDIIDELYQAVRDAAASNKISLSADVALQRMRDVVSQVGLSVETQSGGTAYSAEPSGSQSGPNPTVINNYYYNEGPPAVTYYAPPPDYSYMYGWVPFPFWCAGFRFSGFFILHDFHRTVFIDNRVVVVSNHFNDIRRHRVVRIDPIARRDGNTIANTSVTRTRGFVPVGPGRESTIVNTPRTRAVNGSSAVIPPSRSNAIVTPPRSDTPAGLPAGSGVNFSRPSKDERTMSLPARDAGVVNSRRVEGNMNVSPSRSDGFVGVPRSERSVIPHVTRGEGSSGPSRGSRIMSLPSRGSGFDRMSTQGRGAFVGRGRR
jgi:hypothetical protein